MLHHELKAEGHYPDSGYTDQIGFSDCVLTSNKNEHVLQIECKCLAYEMQNYVQEQSSKRPSAFFPGASLTVSRGFVHHAPFF